MQLFIDKKVSCHAAVTSGAQIDVWDNESQKYLIAQLYATVYW